MNAKNMSRRDFIKIAAIGAAVGVAGGACGKAATPTAEVGTAPTAAPIAAATEAAVKAPIVVRFLEYYSTNWDTWGPSCDKWAEEFAAKYPDQDVKVERNTFVGDANWEDTEMAAAQSGNMEDVFPLQAWFIPPYLDLVPLAPTDAVRASVEGGEAAWSSGYTWKGKKYDLPHYGGPLLAWTNDDILTKAGVEFPKTWDEIIPVGQKVTDPANSIYATSMMLGAGGGNHLGWAEFFPWLAQAGGAMMDDQGKLVINNPEAVLVLEKWKEMEDAGILIPGSLTNVGSFSLSSMSAGQLAWQSYEGPWMFPHLASADIKYKSKGNTVPAGPAGPIAMAYCGALGLNAKAKNPEYAAAWGLYLTADNGALEWGKSLKMTFAYTPISERIVAELPGLQPEIDQAKLGAIGFPTMPAWNELVQAMSTRIGEFWTGAKTPMAALDAIVSDFEVAASRT